MRRALPRSIELDRELHSFRGPRLDTHGVEILSGVERRVDPGDPVADPLQELGEVFLLFLLIRAEDAIDERHCPAGSSDFFLRHAPCVHLLTKGGQHDELRVARARFRARRRSSRCGRRPVPLAELRQRARDRVDFDGRECSNAVAEPGVRDVGKRWPIELHGACAMLNREPLVVRRLEVVRLLSDRVADVFEVPGCFHHFYQRGLDPAGKSLVVDRLSAERAASLVDRPGLEQSFGFTHQRRTWQQPRASRGHEMIPRFDGAPVECRRAQGLDLGEQAFAVGRL
jgi:hypothetical protein